MAMILELKLDKNIYFPSQVVNGTISLHCETQELIKSLKLRFYKKVKMSVKNIDGNTPDVIIDTENITNDQSCFICENTELKIGCNTFPFSFKVQSNENGTGVAKNYFYDSVCCLESSFLVQAICDTVKEQFTIEKYVSIVNDLKEKSFIDTKIKSSTFLCFFPKSICFRIQSDKLWYSRGDTINFTFQSLNKTAAPTVGSISANLYQLVLFNKPTFKTVKSKLITSFSAMPQSKNNFWLQFRVPMALSPNISDDDFTVQNVIIFHLNLFNGKQLKIKKQLNIGEAHFEVPKQSLNISSDNYVFVARHLEYHNLNKAK